MTFVPDLFTTPTGAGNQPLRDAVRLEVEQPPAGLTNLVQNPSGELGGFGWVTPVANGTLFGLNSTPYTVPASGLYWLFYKHGSNVAGQWFWCEPFDLAAGQYVAATWYVGWVQYTLHRMRWDWLDGSGAILSSSTWQNYSGQNMACARAAMVAPAGTVQAQLRIELGKGGTFPHNTGTGGSMYNGFAFRDVRVAKAATAGALADLSTLETATWQNILAPAHALTIQREELNVGTLTASVLDAALDPSTASTIRPGKRIRVTAYNAGSAAYEPLYTGQITRATVTYDPTRTDVRRARVDIEAADNIAALANYPRANGVDFLPALASVVEGTGVPWVLDGWSQQYGSPTIVSKNEGASALDQVALTRDTIRGYAYVDRWNTLRAVTASDPSALARHQDRNQMVNGDFLNDIDGWTVGLNCTLAHYPSTPNGIKAKATAAGQITFKSPRVPYKPGAMWRLWWNYQALTNTRTGNVTIAWYNAVGTLVGSEVLTSGGYTLDTTYRRFNAVPAGDPATAVEFELVFQVGSCAANDEFVIREVLAVRPVAKWDEAVYSDLDVSYDTDRVINQVAVRFLTYNTATGETTETMYGPWEDGASIAQWGPRRAEFTLHGSSAGLAAYAAAVLAANATPTVRVNSVRVPIKRGTDQTGAKAFVDLYDLIQVANTAVGLDTYAETMSRAVGITHTITPDGWLLDVSFVAQQSVAPPTAQPALTGAAAVGLPYAFRSKTTTQAITPASTWVVVTFPTETDTTTGALAYNTGTGVFTVPRPGRYLVAASVQLAAGTSGRRLAVVRRNGTEVQRAEDLTANAINLAVAAVVSCAAGDTLDVSAFITGPTTLNAGNPSRVQVTWLGE